MGQSDFDRLDKSRHGKPSIYTNILHLHLVKQLGSNPRKYGYLLNSHSQTETE